MVFRNIKSDVHLGSITGGTEINGCLALAVPVLPFYPAQIQGAALGMDVVVLDTENYEKTGVPRELIGTQGELSCRTPFPSQPLKFWGDEDGSRYEKAYFSVIPGVCFPIT